MELIDRYVAEVGRRLPPKQRLDIEAELRSLLVDNLEARAQGEPTQKDVVDLLREFGPPEKMAASYWPEGQYLIGPTLYPFFRMVAGIALMVAVIVQLVLLGVALIFGSETLDVGTFASNFIPTIVSVFGWVVLAFAIMQRLNLRPKNEEQAWDPLSLPPVKELDPVSRVGTAVEIALGLIFVVLLSTLPGELPQLLPPDVRVYISPILLEYLPLLILSAVLGVGLNVILLWRGKWETGTRLAKIAINLFGIAILALLVNAHTAWLAERGASGLISGIQRIPQDGQLSLAQTEILVMQVYRMVFGVALFGTLIDTLQVGWRLVKSLFDKSGLISLPPSGAKTAG